MKIAIVLPTYNEAENIKKLIPVLFGICKSNKTDCTIIVVDDNSPDGTGDIVEGLKKKFNIVLIRRKGKLGLGSAYITGFHRAFDLGVDFVFSMDSDFQHPPEKIPEFLEKISQGYDAVIGSRYVEGGGSCLTGWRLATSRGAGWISKIVLGLPVNDPTAGYKCYRASALKSIELDSIKTAGYSFQEEILFMLVQHGYRLTEIPIYFDKRQSGESKLGKNEVIQFFFNMVRLGAQRIKRKIF